MFLRFEEDRVINVEKIMEAFYDHETGRLIINFGNNNIIRNEMRQKKADEFLRQLASYPSFSSKDKYWG